MEKFVWPKETTTQMQKFNIIDEWVLITPELADYLIKKSDTMLNGIRNRSKSEAKIRQYSIDMHTGNWDERTGEPIKLDEFGLCIDGNNRLHAVKRSGKSIWFNVKRNIPRRSFKYLDSGKQRHGHDTLYSIGAKNTTKLAGTIRLIYAYKNINNPIKDHRTILTNHEMEDIYLSNIDLYNESISYTLPLYKRFGGLIKPTCLAALYYLATELGYNEEVKRFLERLIIYQHDEGMQTLTKKLVEEKTRFGRQKMRIELQFAFIIKVFNGFIYNFPVKILRFYEDEKFPRIGVSDNKHKSMFLNY